MRGIPVLIVAFACLFSTSRVQGQHTLPTQFVRGTVLDKFTLSPIHGALVLMTDSLLQKGAVTNEEGFFEIREVPVGRQSFIVSFLGYHKYDLVVMVFSGKPTVLEILLEEQYTELEEITITATNKGETLNELAYSSSRSFNMEDTERYAGTNGDPARMASYFAGVMATGDTRNDIIIRGNTPLGLLWKVEGVPIPNPNHFALAGTNGGAISMLNNNLLSHSDFLTGAFPAEYGNALSGVFDLNMRSGDKKERHVMTQMGIGGLEAGVEGPFVKGKNPSFLIHYRHAFLELIELAGLTLPSGIPRYTDLSYKLTFPTAHAGTFSLWGLGGKGSISTLGQNSEFKFDNYMNTRLHSGMGATGITHKLPVGKASLLQTCVAVNGYYTRVSVDSIHQVALPFYANNFREWRNNVSSTFKTRLTSNIRLSTGASYQGYSMNYKDSVLLNQSYMTGTRHQGRYALQEAFIQGELLVSEQLQYTIGLHSQWMSSNRSLYAGPRMALQYQATGKTTLHAGYGLHAMTQAGSVYFYRSPYETQSSVSNEGLGFSKSHHFVGGVKHHFTPHVRLKTDVYYQYLFQIPVEARPSAWSAINYGGDFINILQDSLVNEGTGRNAGIEITMEKFYHGNSYYMFTASVFDSNYRGSDGVARNTLFNSNYVFNALSGYEFRIKEANRLSINVNLAWAGGLRPLAINLQKSREEGFTVYDLENPYQERARDFIKLNIKVLQRVNKEKISFESGFELNNILNRKNEFMKSYNPVTGTIQTDYQLGIMPGGMFRVYF